MIRRLIILLLIVGCENGGFEEGDYTCVLNTATITNNNTMISNVSDTLTIRGYTMDGAISRCENNFSEADSVWCTCTREWRIGIF
jgi:hypothetical protein